MDLVHDPLTWGLSRLRRLRSSERWQMYSTQVAPNVFVIRVLTSRLGTEQCRSRSLQSLARSKTRQFSGACDSCG